MLPLLLPEPREMTLADDEFYLLPEQAYITIPNRHYLFVARWFQPSLDELGLDWQIVANSGKHWLGIHLIENEQVPEQGYHLTISDTGIQIEGVGAGLFYGICTLRQLILQYGRELPYLHISDYPDFPARGIMLDISRDKVPTMDTLYLLIDEMASLKINQFQLYIEHTYAYIGHEDVWQLASPITADEMMQLDSYCKERFVEFVPNQNSLGHMERWLKFPQYKPLAEKPDGFDPPWGGPRRLPSTLDPQNPNSFRLISSLYDQFLPNFSSPLFNVGCDEPFELGHGKNKEAVQARGGRIYLNWLLKLYEDVSKRGRFMMFWGDIIKNYPKLVPELPKDMIALEWGYEANHDFENPCKLFANSGLPFYVCPGTSGWNSLIGRTNNAMANLRNAAKYGLQYGAIGYLITEWGDNGHMQSMPSNYLGYTYGAAVSWHYEHNQDIDIASALNQFIFHDEADLMGQLVYDLGNAYLELEWSNFNGHLLAYTAQLPHRRQEIKDENGLKDRLNADDIYHMIEHLGTLKTKFSETDMQRADAKLIIREFKHTIELVQHAALWLLIIRKESAISARALLLDLERIINQQREIWLARNRRGGLEDSIARLDSMREDYLAIMEGML